MQAINMTLRLLAVKEGFARVLLRVNSNNVTFVNATHLDSL